jgi:hypothetical protein
VVDNEILIVGHGLDRVLGRNPFKVLIDFFSQFYIQHILFFDVILDLTHFKAWIILLILKRQLGFFLQSLLIISPSDKKCKSALSFLFIVLEIAIVAGQFKLLNTFSILLSILKLSCVFIDIFFILYTAVAFPTKESIFEDATFFSGPRKTPSLTM